MGANEMNAYKPAYLHVMDGLGFGFHNKGPVVTTFDIRKNFDGPIMANVGLTKDMAEGMVRSGTVCKQLAPGTRVHLRELVGPNRCQGIHRLSVLQGRGDDGRRKEGDDGIGEVGCGISTWISFKAR